MYEDIEVIRKESEFSVDEDGQKLLIISGGKACDELIQVLVRQEQYSMIITADSGLNIAGRLGLKPDFIVGDFDSADKAMLDKYKAMSVPIISYPAEKDMTDTQIAIELAIKHKPVRIDIAGATGSRIDHMLANIQLLMLPMQLGIDACIIDNNNKVYLRNKCFTITKEEQYGKYVSLLPFTDEVRGLSLIGFKYPLDNVILSAGTSLCISNEISAAKAEVLFTEGILLVMETKD